MPSRAKKDKRNLKNKANRWVKILFDALPDLCERLKAEKKYTIFRANIFTRDKLYHMNEHGKHYISEDNMAEYTQQDAALEVFLSFSDHNYHSFWIPIKSFDKIHLGYIPPYTSSAMGYRYHFFNTTYDPIICQWMEEVIYRQLAVRRMKAIKPDLIAAAWHPRRVERWIEQGVELEDL